MMYKYESVIDLDEDVNNKDNKNTINDFYVKNKFFNGLINKALNDPVNFFIGVFIFFILVMMILIVISQVLKVF